ncbi:MAG: hypothetical protein IJI27_05485 [Oscillospiraceae bacterium]|nr:hypothetical protein [Oscillospiraceae bacterium]
MNDIKYYELFISNPESPLPDDQEPAMCIKGVRKPTKEEATAFIAADLPIYGENLSVVDVYEINPSYAASCYDLSYEDRWPVFGI